MLQSLARLTHQQPPRRPSYLFSLEAISIPGVTNPLSVNELCVVLTAHIEVRVSERVGERRPRQTRCVIIVHS